MSGRNRLYLALDVSVAVAFLLSLATGLAWLLAGQGGCQGGQNAKALVLGLTRQTWNDLHTWFSVVMVAGVALHIALHWKWIVGVTARLWAGRANKARWNYAFDLLIGITFVLATLTGLVFLVVGSRGYQGGRNPEFSAAILGLARQTWSNLHAWFGLLLAAGIVIHQALHWTWITSAVMRSRRLAALPGKPATRASIVSAESDAPWPRTREGEAPVGRRSVRRL